MRNIFTLVYQQGTKICFKSKFGIYLVCRFFRREIQFFRVDVCFPELKLYVAVFAIKVYSCAAEIYVDTF